MLKSNKNNKDKRIKFGYGSLPPGGVKIAEALRTLLEKKDFNSITTAEIAEASGVNEALIYKYFGSKRELLHSLIDDFHREYVEDMQLRLKGIKGALNKLRKLIWEHINLYDTERVYARVVLIEARTHPGFFESSTYNLVREYTRLFKDIINEGINNGEIRDDISVWSIKQVILGAIEHVCLPNVIFSKKIFADDLTEDICNMIFYGIRRKD